MLNLTYSHITALVIVVVLLLALCVVVIIHNNNEKSRLDEAGDFITRYLKKREAILKASGTKIKIGVYIALVIACPLIAGIIIYISIENAVFAIIAALLSIWIPRSVVELAVRVHKNRFEEWYARSLQQLSASLGAGMSIIQAVEDTAKCRYINESLRKEYASMATRLKMGTPVEAAFHDFAEQIGSQDAKDVAIAIEIQADIGGREAETILEIADNIHERLMLRREVKTIFSQTSSMVYIMDVLAPASMVFFAISNPVYMEAYLESPTMIAVMVVLLALPIMGIFVTNRMLKKVSMKK